MANNRGAGSTVVDTIFAGGGEMGALMHAHDWSTSPLGYPDTWHQALRSAVSMMLPSRHIMFVAWGPELAFLNSYRVSLVASPNARLNVSTQEFLLQFPARRIPASAHPALPASPSR